MSRRQPAVVRGRRQVELVGPHRTPAGRSPLGQRERGISGIPPVVPLPGMPALELDGLVYFYVLAVVIGGSGSMWGACAGAALVWLTRDYLGNLEAVAGRGPLLLGLLFVIAVYTLPRGLAGVRLPPQLTRKRTA
ncbi:hypothetical protein ACTVZO_03095 [Streptomyces sp. IBSNAI002]|uniref:hypothetical protein n=1 Tax=Streptomyces sp. IBSNAI002 TaxID=3457500 RepID=UPI003FD21418